MKELLKKFYDAGVMHEATLNKKYSFEQMLADNAEALQLLQTDVSGRSEQLKCQCKKAKFTRTVDADFNPLCGRCGKAL